MCEINSYFFIIYDFQLEYWAQSFTVQSNSVMLNGSPNVQDFNDNTYLDAFSTETLTWSIVADSMPSSWEYSNCFPNCYPIGPLMEHSVLQTDRAIT